MAKIILCLTSVRGRSGKDTLIEQLTQAGHEVARVAFGDALKEACAEDLQSYWNEPEKLLRWFHSNIKDVPQATLRIRELPEGPYKEWLMFTAPRFGEQSGDWMNTARSPRWHLQQYGTDYRREFLKEPDVWLDAGMKVIANTEADIVVVSDLRQANEYKRLEYLGSITGSVKFVRLHRMWFVPGVDDAPYHVTDLDLIGHKMDATAFNHWGNPAGMVTQLKTQGVI